jgi:hypothetical protein
VVPALAAERLGQLLGEALLGGGGAGVGLRLRQPTGGDGLCEVLALRLHHRVDQRLLGEALLRRQVGQAPACLRSRPQVLAGEAERLRRGRQSGAATVRTAMPAGPMGRLRLDERARHPIGLRRGQRAVADESRERVAERGDPAGRGGGVTGSGKGDGRCGQGQAGQADDAGERAGGERGAHGFLREGGAGGVPAGTCSLRAVPGTHL